MMKSKKTSDGSILDAKHAIPPNLLTIIKMAVVLSGLLISVLMLYVSSLYSRNLIIAVIIFTIIAWVLLVYIVDNANAASYDTDMIKRVDKKNTEGKEVQKYIDASYEELEQLGREELARRDDKEEGD